MASLGSPIPSTDASSERLSCWPQAPAVDAPLLVAQKGIGYRFRRPAPRKTSPRRRNS